MLEKIIFPSLAALLCAGPVWGADAAAPDTAPVSSPAQDLAAAETEVVQPQFPGVSDATVKSATITDVTMHYPVTGNVTVDAILENFAREAVGSFEKMLQEDGVERPDGYASYELLGTYEISRPNGHALSVLFSIYSYSGGAHGMREVTCLNFALPAGKKLTLEDLFGNPQRALEILSAISREKLPAELGSENVDEDMINSGTAPDAANFANLSLLPEAVRVEFEPYQVGPWSAGLPQLTIPLADLAEAAPSRAVWPDFQALPPDADVPQDARAGGAGKKAGAIPGN